MKELINVAVLSRIVSVADVAAVLSGTVAVSDVAAVVSDHVAVADGWLDAAAVPLAVSPALGPHVSFQC